MIQLATEYAAEKDNRIEYWMEQERNKQYVIDSLHHRIAELEDEVKELRIKHMDYKI